MKALWRILMFWAGHENWSLHKLGRRSTDTPTDPRLWSWALTEEDGKRERQQQQSQQSWSRQRLVEQLYLTAYIVVGSIHVGNPLERGSEWGAMGISIKECFWDDYRAAVGLKNWINGDTGIAEWRRVLSSIIEAQRTGLS